MSLVTEYIKLQHEFNQKYGDNSVIFMMVGSFYEIYGYPKHYIRMNKVSDILGIQLTRKNKALDVSESNPYMCGLPCYAISKHLSKLLLNNFTVAIYNQFDKENTNEKDRKLVNIYSPSTYIEEELINNNWLCLIRIDSFVCPIIHKKLLSGYITCIDLSTGQNKIYECYDNKDSPNFVETEIKRILYSINPCEIIIICDNSKLQNNIQKEFIDKMIHVHQIDKKFSNKNYQISVLEKVFGKDKIVNPIEKIGLERNGELLSCYIHLLQFAYEHDNNIINKINIPQLMNTEGELHINNDCLFQLNLIASNKQEYTNGISCLFDVINNTCTKMGSRLLRDRLIRPITNISELENRYNLIDKSLKVTEVYRKLLQNISDLEKKYRKLVLKKLNPFEFASLDISFRNIISILELKYNIFSIEKNDIVKFKNFYQNFLDTFDLEIMSKYDLQNIKTSFFKKGISSKIDELNIRILGINKVFEQISDKLYLFGEKKAKVKICYNEKDGTYFTTTKRCWNGIFQFLEKKLELTYINSKKPLILHLQDLIITKNKNTVKITSKLIDKLSRTLIKNTETIKKLAKKHYFKKLDLYQKKWGENISKIITYISEIDVTISSAYTSKKYSYCKPIIKLKGNKSYVSTKDIRHPIIERIQDDKEYIANDVDIGDTNLLLYGLNSSGKSSLLRSIGCNIILAQMGMYTSCKSFTYFPFTNLLTKISSDDNLFKGQSTFIVEMLELKNILHKADSNSMILCDELTAGTETLSANGIVASAMQLLIENNSNFLFTTHLHELMQFPEIKNNDKIDVYHFDIEVGCDSINYNRKLKKGSGKTKYGVEIAQALGLNKKFIKNAFKYRNLIEGGNTQILNFKKSRYNTKVFVDKCTSCGNIKNLHTHHIYEQKLSDDNDIIKHFPKNIKHNLLILCEQCHMKIHQ